MFSEVFYAVKLINTAMPSTAADNASALLASLRYPP